MNCIGLKYIKLYTVISSLLSSEKNHIKCVTIKKNMLR